MATKKLNTRIQNKIDSEANWNNNPDFIPLKGEMIVYSKDANNNAARVKFGDGVTKLSDLKFAGSGSNGPLTPITKPTVKGSLTYNKSSQTPTWLNYDSSKMTLSGTTSATNAGTYAATFTPLTGYCWEDDQSTNAITVTWTINKVDTRIILGSSTVAVYKDCELHVKVTVLPEDVNGSIHASYDGTDSLYVTEGYDDNDNYGLVIVDDEGSVTDDTRGTITVTFAPSRATHGDYTNYNDSTATINVVAGGVLDGMPWSDIKTLLLDGKEDFANYASIGETKTITLTPNQRIRLPEGEETVKVFLADTYIDDKDYSTGALFAGFKDSEGKDICITPDPEIREKKKLWKGRYSLSTGFADYIPDALDGRYELEFEADDGTATWSSITFSKDSSYVYVYYDDESSPRWTIDVESGYIISAPGYTHSNILIDSSQYVSAELYKFIIGLTDTYIPVDVTFVLKDPPSSPWSLSDDSGIGYNPVTNETIYGISYSAGNGLTLDLGGDDYRQVADNWDRYLRLNGDINPFTGGQIKAFFENVEDCDASNVNICTGWWTFDDNPDLAYLVHEENDYYEPNSTYDGTPCFRIYGEFEVGSGYTGNELVIIPESDQIILDDNLLFFGTFQNSSYQNICVHSIDVEHIDPWLCHEILSEIGQKYEVKGSWIWNPSVASNLANFQQYSTGIGYFGINVNFSVADAFGYETQCSELNWSDTGYLHYVVDNAAAIFISVVDSAAGAYTFAPQFAAMHFGDEPQSVPKFIYEFLVANADNMSEGFMSNTQVPGAFSYWYKTNLRHYVLGGCTKAGVTTSGNAATNVVPNTLMEALPSELREVLSPIGDGSGYQQTMDYLTLPNPTELNFPITFIQGTTRLGADGTDWSYKINYYKNVNPTAKYDIWNKDKLVNWFTSAGYYPSDGGGTIDAPMYWVLAGTDTQQNTPTYVKKCAPELLTAGLAPIFLIGSTTSQQVECSHNWDYYYSDNGDGNHYYEEYCTECGEIWASGEEGHSWLIMEAECEECGEWVNVCEHCGAWSCGH